jgi:hypothetical protein
MALAAGLIAAVAVAAPVCSTLPPAAPAWMPSSTDAAPLAVKPPVMVLQRRRADGNPRAPATLLVRPAADGREAAVYAADAHGVGFPARRLPPTEARAVLDALARAQRGAGTTAGAVAEVRAAGRGARD